MQHRISPERAGAHGPEMAKAVEACVHCGFCLPTCPTYRVLGEEMDSPRGRIVLMKEALEGREVVSASQQYIDQCLGCQACVTACPSGVPYGDLITAYRAWSETRKRRTLPERLRRLLLLSTLPYPRRFRLAATLGRAAYPFRRLFPGALRPMLELLPPRLAAPLKVPAINRPPGTPRARVGLLLGCVQRVIAPEIQESTIRVLLENEVEVVVPHEQACCGALAMHVGAHDSARKTALLNLRAFADDLDAIVTNASGCGSGMHEYPLLFKGTPQEEDARRIAGKVMDITVFLDRLGLRPPPALSSPCNVAYHDACHLAHAQGIRDAPRRILRAIPGLTLMEPRDWEICCGSAGTYNIEHPKIAAQLGSDKADRLAETGADFVATGNIGCMTQIRYHLLGREKTLPVFHTIEVLDRAYRRVSLDAGQSQG